MNVDKLINLIKEEVRNTLREELKDLLNEAVEYASRPNIESPRNVEFEISKPVNTTPKDTLQIRKAFSDTNPLASLLEETKRAMNSEDFKEFGNTVPAPGMNESAYAPSHSSDVGLDISNLDFIKKAKSILNATNSKK